MGVQDRSKAGLAIFRYSLLSTQGGDDLIDPAPAVQGWLAHQNRALRDIRNGTIHDLTGGVKILLDVSAEVVQRYWDFKAAKKVRYDGANYNSARRAWKLIAF